MMTEFHFCIGLFSVSFSDFWYHRLFLLNTISCSYTFIQVQALVPLLLFEFTVIL